MRICQSNIEAILLQQSVDKREHSSGVHIYFTNILAILLSQKNQHKNIILKIIFLRVENWLNNIGSILLQYCYGREPDIILKKQCWNGNHGMQQHCSHIASIYKSVEEILANMGNMTKQYWSNVAPILGISRNVMRKVVYSKKSFWNFSTIFCVWFGQRALTFHGKFWQIWSNIY